FMTADPDVLLQSTWQELADEGVVVDRRRGGLDDPVAGVVHLRDREGVEADVLLARWKWELSVLQRAEPLDLGEFTVAVPRTADLILLKLAAGGGVDLLDATE